MNSLINNVIIFSLGAAIGSLVTCRVLYNKAFDKAYAEADAKWREHYDNKDEKPQEESEETEDKSEDCIEGPTDDEPEEEIWYDPLDEKDDAFERLEALIKRQGYNKEKNKEENKEENKNEESDSKMMEIAEPYVIVPESFEEYYDGMTLLYHTDGIVTDLRHNIVPNYEELVGKDAFKHFDEFDDPDAAYFRNDRLGMDYEVLREGIPFSSLGK